MRPSSRVPAAHTTARLYRYFAPRYGSLNRSLPPPMGNSTTKNGLVALPEVADLGIEE